MLTMVVSLILGMGVPHHGSLPDAGAAGGSGVKADERAAPGGPPVHFLLWNHFQRDSAGGSGAYAAAGVARCNPTRTGVFAFKLSLSGFILPFMFVYNPVLLMQGRGAGDYTVVNHRAAWNLQPVGRAGEVRVQWNINRAERLVLLASALLLIIPGTITDLIGFASCWDFPHQDGGGEKETMQRHKLYKEKRRNDMKKSCNPRDGYGVGRCMFALGSRMFQPAGGRGLRGRRQHGGG